MSDRIADPTGDFPKRIGMSGRRRPAERRRGDREGRRHAIVPRCYSTAGTVHVSAVHTGGLRGTGG
jgi:hypothetical protein